MLVTRLNRAFQHGTELFFNSVGTYIPSRRLRLIMLRSAGANVGKKTSVLRGTVILGMKNLKLGESTSIGFRCMLDATGGIEIGDCVVIASDVHIITASHDPNTDDFATYRAPVIIRDFAWLASRSTILPGVHVGLGGVVAAGAVVTKNVLDKTLVAGVPARYLSSRNSGLDYDPSYWPRFY